MNIIVEWLDWTWKSSLTKNFSKKIEWEIFDIKNEIEGIYDIDKWEKNFSFLFSLENKVFDRHFLSILVYWKLTQEEKYIRKINEEEIFKEFLEKNKNFIFLFRYFWFEANYEKMLWRQNNKKEKFSKHDKNMMKKAYFFLYSKTFHDLYDDFEKYLNDNYTNSNFYLAKQNVSFYKNYTRNTLKIILEKYNELKSS